MAGRFDFILDFLNVDGIKRRKAEWLESLDDELERAINFDRESGVISFPTHNETGELSEDIWTFDDFILNILDQEILPALTSEFRILRYGNEPSLKVYKKSEISEILMRLHLDLEARINYLEKSVSFIPKTLDSFKRVNKNILKYNSRQDKDGKLQQNIYLESEFKGYKITDKTINNSSELLKEITNYLVRNNLIQEKDKENFISLFSEGWHEKLIDWKGIPKDFYALYNALFLKADTDIPPLIEVIGSKPRLRLLLECFRVFDEDTKTLLTSKTIKRYNSKPLQNATNKAIRELIDKHRDK